MKWTGHLDSSMWTLSLILGLASAQFQLSTEVVVSATDPTTQVNTRQISQSFPQKLLRDPQTSTGTYTNINIKKYEI